MQEIIELVIFGLIALLLGTGLLWGVGWLLDLVGIIFRFVAGLIWSLLRFIIPIVIVGGVAYALFRFFQSLSDRGTDSEAAPAAVTTLPRPTVPTRRATTPETKRRAEPAFLTERRPSIALGPTFC